MIFVIDSFVKKLKEVGENVIGFGVGEFDFDIFDNIKYVVVLVIVKGYIKYMLVVGINCLKEVIVKYYKENYVVDYFLDEVVVLNGVKYLFMNVFFVFLNDGDEVFLLFLYWVIYLEFIKFVGGKVVVVLIIKEKNYKIIVFDIERYVMLKIKVFVLNLFLNFIGMVYIYDEFK